MISMVSGRRTYSVRDATMQTLIEWVTKDPDKEQALKNQEQFWFQVGGKFRL